MITDDDLLNRATAALRAAAGIHNFRALLVIRDHPGEVYDFISRAVIAAGGTIRLPINDLQRAGLIHQEGKGGKSDPRRYTLTKAGELALQIAEALRPSEEEADAA